jgi:3-deoxy-7-phosphoheptulonate synthase
MIAVLERGCPLKAKAEIVRFVEAEGFRLLVTETGGESLVGVIGPGAEALASRLAAMPGVAEVRPVAAPYPQVSREHHPEPTRVKVGPVTIGGDEVVVIGGPCAVESEAQLLATARAVAAAGGRMLRGGAFKPRSSPYTFQGLEEEGLKLLALARAETGLPIVTEVVAPEDVELVARYADVLQVGSRNMQNFRLLSAVGQQPRAVLLKRGLMATIEEWLMAAEYVVAAGNPRVVLCERGIRTFERATRNTLDIAAVPVLRQLTHLPVIVDPSHAAGRRELVPALACAAVAAGADGLIVETHPDPDRALSDGRQSLALPGFEDLVRACARVAVAVGRTLRAPGAVDAAPR